MKDYKKLIDNLRRCRKTDDHSCEGCSYIKDMKTSFCWLIAMSDAADAIGELQDTVQAQDKVLKICAEQLAKSVPKHGEWIWENFYWHCSECGDNPTKGTGYVQCRAKLFSYCPHCGAKMEVQE